MEQDVALISDLDGTLVDTTHLYYQALAETCRVWGIEFSEAIFQKNRSKTVVVWLTEQGIPPELVEQIWTGYCACLDRLLETAQWRPGAPEFLSVIREARVPCALVTLARSASVAVMHGSLKVGDYFPVIIDREAVGKRRKPDPFGIQEALRRLGKRRGIMLGDEPVDAQAGNAAGLPTYHIACRHTPEHDLGLWTGGVITEYRQLLRVWGLENIPETA